MAPAGAEGGGAAHLRALVVDDEPPLVQVVSGYLHRDGFEVLAAADGESAVTLARRHTPDVVVLDLMLPGIDGMEVCRRLRTFSDAYVIMLTARNDEVDTIVGLSVGADDYLTKPFSPRELLARIRAMLRRPRTPPSTDGLATGNRPPVRRFGDLEIDLAGHEVRVAGRAVTLTRTEFDVLDTLSAQPAVAFSRRALLDHVWGGDWYGDDHVIDVHVGNLRRKLDDDAARPRYIRTIRGVGYRMGGG